MITVTKALFILCAMLFCHIIDDYNLQGWLASAKQKEWWKKNAPDKLYEYDYLMALFMHSFSWAFMIMLLPNILSLYYNKFNWVNIILIIINTIIHMYVDNLKANKLKINLIQDQCYHMQQIVVSEIIWYIVFLI